VKCSRPTDVAIFGIAFALRVWALYTPINVDEFAWLFRGIKLVEARGAIVQSAHPGITTSWLTGASAYINCAVQRVIPSFPDIPVGESCWFPMPLVPDNFVVPRLLQAVITSVCLVYFYRLSCRLSNRGVARVATVLLLFEPFYLAYQRYIVTDALQGAFSILSVLLLLLYLRDRRKLDFVASAALLGLATVGKILTAFLVPGLLALVLATELELWPDVFAPQGWKTRALELAAGMGIAVGVMLLAWPALYLNPVQTIEQMAFYLSVEATRGLLYYRGELVDSPAPSFYFSVLLYRLSPLLLTGVGLGILGVFVPRFRLNHRAIAIALLAVVGSTLIILTVFDTKLDRYVLFLIPELTFVAALGWQTLAVHGARLWQLRSLQAQSFAVLGVVQFAVLWTCQPYYLSFFNPWMGGAPGARSVLMFGQGEGFDLVGDWLNRTPEGTDQTVASWYAGVLITYFSGPVISINREYEPSPEFWQQSNRVVFYVNQLQRRLPSQRFIDYFTTQISEFTVQFRGVDYVWVYPGPLASDRALATLQVENSTCPDEPVCLRGFDINIAEDTAAIALYWDIRESVPADWEVAIALNDAGDKAIVRATEPPFGGFLDPSELPVGKTIRDVHRLVLPTDAAPAQLDVLDGTYRLPLPAS